MNMIREILRPKTVRPVIDALKKAGSAGMTRMNVAGCVSEPHIPAVPDRLSDCFYRTCTTGGDAELL